MSAFADFYAESNWGLEFGARASGYTLGYHIGQDIKTKLDGIPSGGVAIPAVEAGVVVDVRRTDALGGLVVVRSAPERFWTYCHQKAQAPVGSTLARGDTVSLSAGEDDDHGSMWSGSHLHLVCSTRPTTAYVPVESEVIDPRPYIRAALVAAAAAAITPIIIPEDDMSLLITHKLAGAQNPRTLLLTPSSITHVKSSDVVKALGATHVPVSDSDDELDARRVVEAYGWPWTRLPELAPGEAFLRAPDGTLTKTNAGRARW